MFYKAIKDNKVVDVLDHLAFVKYCPKRDRVVLALQQEAEGIVSSDQKGFWQVRGIKPFPKGEYSTVDLIKISKEEYHQLKALNGKTPEEIIDEYTLLLIEEGAL